MVLSKTETKVEKSLSNVPMGKNKSGREWKKVQSKRASSQKRVGVMEHMSISFEDKKQAREKKDFVKSIEKNMKDENKRKIEEIKKLREERQQRKLVNEQKNSAYQMINPEKLKGMSKKQLRMIRKTSVNKAGQVEFVSPWGKEKK
eukprot:gene8111-16653_t